MFDLVVLRRPRLPGAGSRRPAHHHGRTLSRVAPQASGKGFGSPAAKDAPNKGKGATDRESVSADRPLKKVVDEAVRKVERRSGGGGGGGGARPIDPEEAARGKYDYVEVKSWGSGEPSALGNLEIKSFSRQFSGGGGSGSGGEGPALPFYEALARQLELAQSRGCLEIAGERGGHKTVPFDQWSFREGRYLQYLTDLLAVHTALEQALLAVAPTAADASAAAPEAGSSSSGPKGSATETTEAGAGGLTLVGALRQLAADTRGLQRTLAIRHDMVRLVTTSQTDGSENTAGSNGSSSGSANATAGAAAAAGTAAEQLSAAIPRVGTMAKTYAAYVSKISSELSAALAAGGGGSPSAAAEAAAAKLLAHAYSLHVTHLTTGQRIGATAAERLGLFGRGATSTYMEYPPEVADPMRSFVQAVNAAGSQLRSAADRGAVFDELPEAMKNTALLLQALAHAN